MPRVVLYGDVNLNILDGSAIWLVSMAEALAQAGCEVDVQLKAVDKTDRLTKRLRKVRNVNVIPARPSHGLSEMTHAEVRKMIELLVSKYNPDIVIARGIDVCITLSQSPEIASRLWSYVTELHYPTSEMSAHTLDKIHHIAAESRRVFAQTEDARSYLEAVIPEAAGKTLVLTPMIPDEFFAEKEKISAEGDPLRLVYSGKFAKDWLTLEMTQLVRELSRNSISSELTMVGDKFQKAPGDPTWQSRMRDVFENPPTGVTFTGGVSREESQSIIESNDVGLSWRSTFLDQSLEISTKVLEYSASGVPPILNRTDAHEAIFGEDYPLFVEMDHTSAADIASVIADAAPKLKEIRERVQKSVEPYRLSVRAGVIRGYIERFIGSNSRHAVVTRPLKLVLASHDLKFAGELIELLQVRPDIELMVDHWTTLHTHDESKSKELVEWADIVMCEWTGPNVVWYSNNKKPGQRLITRLHGFEVRNNAPWLPRINFDEVDKVITVSELYREMTSSVAGWDVEKITVIPNAVDAVDLGRPKISGSEHRIGLVGFVPWLKRPDRALDFIAEVAKQHPDVTLHIKGRMPWEYAHEWNKEDQRADYEALFRRIGEDPNLRHRVVFEPFGADMGNWLTKIGFVLSPSSIESFHLAPAEGMASGAIPIFWERDGARTIFGDEFVFESTQEAAKFASDIIGDPDALQQAQESAIEYAQRFDLEVVNEQWLDIIFEGRNTGG